MAITVESFVGYSTTTGAASFTTGSITPAGSDRAIVVGIVFNNNNRETTSGQDVTAVTFNSSTPLSLSAVSGTKTANDGVGATAYDDGVAELFYAVAPDASAHTVTVTIENATSADEGMFIGVWVLSGVDQTTPVDNGTANKSEAGSNNPAVTVTSAADDLTLGIGFFEAHAATVTHAAGPTQRYNVNLGGVSGDNGWMFDWAGAASRAYSWSASATDKWVASGCNINVKAATYTYDQIKFRWRNDDGSESAATWQAVEGTNPSTVSVDTKTRLRIEFTNDDATNSGDANETFKWRYSHKGGAYTDLTTTSSVVKIVDSTNLTDGGDTTQQLGSGTFETNNNAVQDASNTFQITGTMAPSDVCEAEVCFEIVREDVDDGDTIDFRLYESAGSVEFDGYTKTPRATVQKPAEYTQTSFQVFKKDLSD